MPAVSEVELEGWVTAHGSTELSEVPTSLKKVLAFKLLNQRYDIELLLSEKGILKRDVNKESDIFFVDHFLRFARIDDIKKVLTDTLSQRLKNLGGLTINDNDDDWLEKSVWKFAEPLILGNKFSGAFFLEEEFGCLVPRAMIEDGSVANWCVVSHAGETYTVLWPASDWKSGEQLVRAPRFSTSRWLALARAEAYIFNDQINHDWKQALTKYYDTLSNDILSYEDDELFTQPPLQAPVRMYTNRAWVQKFVNDSRFEFLSNITDEECNVLFLNSGGIEANRINKNNYTLVSYYDYEATLIQKDHLAHLIATSCSEIGPLAFDLETQFEVALGAILNGDLGQFFVLKPNNLGRSIGVTLTKSLRCVLAHARGPYIIQKYIHSPAALLSDGRKFDFRMVCLLRSAKPLELYAHDRVFIRAAAIPSSASNSDQPTPDQFLTTPHLLQHKESQKHPSNQVVINYLGQERWQQILAQARHRAAKIFFAAAHKFPGFAASSTKARAIYGCDFILDEHYRPCLLEVTFDPSYLADHPNFPDPDAEFANDCFRCLFFAEFHRTTRCSLVPPTSPT